MNLRDILITTLAVGLFLLLGCKQKLNLITHWTDQAITIDGDMTDWADLPTTYFEDEGLAIALANDTDNLYVLFRARDQRWAQIIRRRGLTLNFDPSGGKDEVFRLRFRGGPDFKQTDPSQLHNGYPESSSSKWERRGGPRESGPDDQPLLTCFVKDRIVEKSIPTDGAQGPSAAFAEHLSFYIYEFRVPLSPSEVRYYGLGVAPGGELGINITWSGTVNMLHDSPRGNRSRGGGSGKGSGLGGGGGGGRRGNGAGGERNMTGQQRPTPQLHEVHIRTILAGHPSIEAAQK